jgi:uncharacterized protein YdeI (YjbR/CyaY-like superfamily)
MEPIFFASQLDFREWLEQHHDKETELIVGFYKVGSGKPSMTWSESVDQALCFGWIDGVKHSIDAESYKQRFTPRKATSIWSAVNIKKIAELTQKGLMRPAGIAIYEKRTDKNSKGYSYETASVTLSPEYDAQIRANQPAWLYFEALAPGYRRSSVAWIMSAKQAATQQTRLKKLIDDCAAGINQWKDSKYKK